MIAALKLLTILWLFSCFIAFVEVSAALRLLTSLFLIVLSFGHLSGRVRAFLEIRCQVLHNTYQ